MKTAIITFARAAIPTKGHQVLFNTVNELAEKEQGTPMIFLSHSFDAKKNPIDYYTKVAFLTSIGINSIIESNTVRTMFDVLNLCELEKYEKVIFVVGSDRLDEVKSRVAPYLGSGGSNNLSFSFDVVSAGERNPDDDTNVSGISGTKMRQFVEKNDFVSFKEWIAGPASTRDIKKVWDTARTTMGLS